MNKIVFSMRVSHEILEWLDILATRTLRSRASVIRWLIQEAYLNLGKPNSSAGDVQNPLGAEGTQLNPANFQGGKE